MGEGEFLNNRPEIDYSRWGELQRFYAGLKSDSPLKMKIENNILELYSEPYESKKHVAVAVGRLLQIPAIKQKIINAINHSEFQSFGQALQDEFLFSATKLQLFEVSGFVVRKFTSEGRLGEFLMCSSIPPHLEQVGEDDIWRIKIVEKLFDDSSEDTCKSIHMQVQETAKFSRNFRLVIQKYLSSVESSEEFHLMLDKVITEHQP